MGDSNTETFRVAHWNNPWSGRERYEKTGNSAHFHNTVLWKVWSANNNAGKS